VKAKRKDFSEGGEAILVQSTCKCMDIVPKHMHIYFVRCVYTALCTACAFKEWWIKGAASTCRALGCHNGVMLVFTFIAASRVSMISLTILSPWRCEREICKIFHCAKYRLSSQLADASGFLFTIRFCLQNVCIY